MSRPSDYISKVPHVKRKKDHTLKIKQIKTTIDIVSNWICPKCDKGNVRVYNNINQHRSYYIYRTHEPDRENSKYSSYKDTDIYKRDICVHCKETVDVFIMNASRLHDGWGNPHIYNPDEKERRQ